MNRPEIAPPALWHFPTPRTWRLDNGIEVWAFDLPGQHVLTAELCLDAPLAVEDRTVEGAATLALRVSDEGTLANPDGRIAELLENCGAAYEGAAMTSATHCTLDVPATRLATALQLFAEIVRTPAYAAADVERHVALRLAEIEQAKVSPAASAGMATRMVLHDASSRSHRAAGGEADSVARITPETLHTFHDRWWRPAGAVLVVAGALPEGVDDMVADAFGDWQGPADKAGHQAPAFAHPSPMVDGRPLVHLVDRPGTVAAELRLVGPSIDRHDPEFAALQVACTAMGGSFNSRINHVLREEKGYTYGAHLSTSPARTAGSWTMGGSFRTEVATAALSETLRLLKLDENPLTSAEIDDAVAYQLGIAPLRYATAAGVAGQAVSLAAAGWTADFVNTHFGNVRRVTAEQAGAAFSRVVRAERAHVVMVGDATVLRPQLVAEGYAVTDLTV